MSTEGASGWFNHRHWWIDLHDTDPTTTQLASAHESHHRQLAYSTSFGMLCLLLAELDDHHPSATSGDTLEALIACSSTTQEMFATWSSLRALGRGPETLERYRHYRSYWQIAEDLTASITSPYLRFHAVHALSRACMQAPVAGPAADVGLDRLTLADLELRLHPDLRLRHLRRHRPDWTDALEVVRGRARTDAVLAELVDRPDLEASSFEPQLHDRWQLVNTTLYEYIAGALNGAGHPTGTHDEQLEQSSTPLAAARAAAPDHTTAFEAGGPRDPSRAAQLVLRNIEAEGFNNGPILRHRWLSGTTKLDAIPGAVGPDAHVFITIGPARTLLGSYAIPDVGRGPLVCARRLVVDEDGNPTVELLNLTRRDPRRELDSLETSAVALISMSVLNVPLAQGWESQLRSATAVLVDRSLGAHLDLWLSNVGTAFHHCLLRLESFGRSLPVLIGLLRQPDVGDSHLMIRPLSDAAARIHKAAFEEIDPTRQRLVDDPTILDGRPGLSLVLGHLAGEQTHFPSVIEPL